MEKWFIPKKIDIVENIRTVSNYVKRELEKKQKLALNFNKRQKIKPVMKWGQNFTHVLVSVKFAHRFDSPSCLDLWGTQLNFTDSTFHLNSLGIQANMPIEFDIELPLAEKIDPNYSIYVEESVGTIVIKMQKEQKNKIWRRITPTDFDSSEVAMKIWWELADIYSDAMKKYNRLIDSEEDEKDRVNFF